MKVRKKFAIIALAAVAVGGCGTPDKPVPDAGEETVWDPNGVTGQQAALYLADLQSLDSRLSDPAEADFYLEVGMGLCTGFAELGTPGNLDAVARSINGHESETFMASAMTAATTRLCPDLGTALDGYLIMLGHGDMPRYGGISMALNERLHP